MKLLLALSATYVGIEFVDYLSGVISHIINGDYTSHVAKVGALKKLAIVVLVVALPIFSEILVTFGTRYHLEIPSEISVFSALFIIKQIAIEFSSVGENLKLLKGDEKSVISYGDMLDVVEDAETKNVPPTTPTVETPKETTKKEEVIEDVIEDGEKEEVRENEN